MATATVQFVPPKPVAPEVSTVTLVLSKAEARTLAELITAVGGDPYKSARVYIDSIDDALTSIGVRADHSAFGTSRIKTGSIYFTDSSKQEVEQQ